jgi:hypothetical protein
MTPTPTAEEVFHDLESQAGLLRFLNDSAAISPEMPDAAALSGISDVCREIQVWARSTRRSLSVEALFMGSPPEGSCLSRCARLRATARLGARR